MKKQMSIKDKILAAQAKQIVIPQIVRLTDREIQSERNLTQVIVYLINRLDVVMDFWMPKQKAIVNTAGMSRTKAKKIKKKAAELNMYANALADSQEKGLVKSRELAINLLNKVNRAGNRASAETLKRYLKEQLESFVVGKTSIETGKVIKSLDDCKAQVKQLEAIPEEITVHSRMIFLSMNVIIDKFENTLTRLNMMDDLLALYENLIEYDIVLREILL